MEVIDRKAGVTLVYGYGNPGRCDDGLGPALAAALEALELPGVAVASNLQLAIEDAIDVARYDVVLFAHAARVGPAPFWFEAVPPAEHIGFTTHGLSPAGLVAIARSLFAATSRAYVLGVRGYEWSALCGRFSDRAAAHLDAALGFMRHALEERQFDDYVQQYGIGARRNGGTSEERRYERRKVRGLVCGR